MAAGVIPVSSCIILVIKFGAYAKPDVVWKRNPLKLPTINQHDRKHRHHNDDDEEEDNDVDDSIFIFLLVNAEKMEKLF
jgi:hypothetical protein